MICLESIIAWIDKGLDEEIAISFLDTIAANETWRSICSKTGKNPIEPKKANYKDLERLTLPDITNLDKIKHDVSNQFQIFILTLWFPLQGWNKKGLDGLRDSK